MKKRTCRELDQEISERNIKCDILMYLVKILAVTILVSCGVVYGSVICKMQVNSLIASGWREKVNGEPLACICAQKDKNNEYFSRLIEAPAMVKLFDLSGRMIGVGQISDVWDTPKPRAILFVNYTMGLNDIVCR